MLDWWDFQKGWRVQMQLFFSELIFPSGFLPWGAVTLRLIGRIACMTEGGAPIGRALSSSVYWDGMTDQISWKVLGRRIRWSAHRTMSHCCFFLTLVRLQRSGERHLVRFWRRWQHLVSSPSSSIQRWLSYGTKGTEKLRFPSESGGFYQFHVSAEVLCRSSSGGRRGSSGRCFSVRREGRDGRMDLALAAQKGMIAGWHGCLLNLLFAFSSLILGYCPYLSGTTISLLVRLTLHFLFWRGLMESRFN